MYGPLVALESLLGLANLGIAAYLLALLYSAYSLHGTSSFSRTVKMMLVAVFLLIALQAIQVFSLLPSSVLEVLDPMLSMVLLLLLVSAVHEMKKSILAHDHLMRRRARNRVSDVE